ncbi:Non-specific serine/threonine protein kinase [Bertholletia excelsa]
MWGSKGSVNASNGGHGNGVNAERCDAIAVAIDKDKVSQYALKWAIDNLLSRRQIVTLIHVKNRPSSIPTPMGNHVALSDVNDGVAKAFKHQIDNQAKELFLPFRAFCTRKEIKCNEVIVEDTDVARALCEYVRTNLVEILVVGACSKNSLLRFKSSDVPTSVSKGAPDYCNVYVISKSKVTSVRPATRPVPNPPPRPMPFDSNSIPGLMDACNLQNNSKRDRSPFGSRSSFEETDIKSPFNRAGNSYKSPYGEFPPSDTDISFVGSSRLSTDSQDFVMNARLSCSSDTESRNSLSSNPFNSKDQAFMQGMSFGSDNGNSWSASQTMDDVEAEMRRLKQELKQTMDMYSTACKEALTAKQKAMELHRWKQEEEQKLEEARLAQEAALEIAEREKAKTKAAIEAAEAAQRIAELESQKRKNAEMKARKEAEERKRMLDSLAQSDARYRKYTIEEIEAATNHFSDSGKIGEGGYGPVYKCSLDHTQVAVKVLRPDAAQGRSQFQQEVDVLSCIRHPNMVLLLGACPEYGCLVYEYMANGSLEDRLFRRGDTPVLPWQIRFRIAAEISTGLLFLHQTKPEPLVHRDLKPANILLDRNFVSKISDVGLARLVPPSVANNITQYRMTATAGTFCYIDPEYQQTGMLGTKSDVYSLGIMLLQIITAKAPMGLTHHVERAIERGTFTDMLDPAVTDWPVEEALTYAKLALKCAELRRKDRPDLRTEVVPELNRLRAFAEDNMRCSDIILCSSPEGYLQMTPQTSVEINGE